MKKPQLFIYLGERLYSYISFLIIRQKERQAVVTNVSSDHGNRRRANGRGCAGLSSPNSWAFPIPSPAWQFYVYKHGGLGPLAVGRPDYGGTSCHVSPHTSNTQHMPPHTHYNKEEGRWECLEIASWWTAENSEMDRTIDSGKGLMTSSAFDPRFQSTAPRGKGRFKVLCLPMGSKAGFHGPCSSSESPLGPKPRTLSTGIKGKPLFQH